MLLPDHLYYLGEGDAPHVELMDDQQVTARVEMLAIGPGRTADERLWRSDLTGCLPESAGGFNGEWQFRIDHGNGRVVHPTVAESFTTALSAVWVQDRQLFSYRPAPLVSPPRVLKIEDFAGSLPTRPLYICLPRGFEEHTDRRYPVIYMHDGQNCFESFVGDSYVGAWQADMAAEFLISQGLMQECIVVGVSHGKEERLMEYLPPYASFTPPSRRPFTKAQKEDDAPASVRPLRPAPGRADATFRYYRDDVAPYVERNYRALAERTQRATCGSSMGGLFALYIAWDHPEFARNHAALSTSFWITRNQNGGLEAIERLRKGPQRDIRLWLDSGTRSGLGRGDDSLRDTRKARDALVEAGYEPGPNFQYYVDEGGIHNESSWAARLPLIFQFLFPAA